MRPGRRSAGGGQGANGEWGADDSRRGDGGPGGDGARRADGGTALVLVLGFTLVAVGFALTSAAAVDLHLERQRLWAVADAAALAAADRVELGDGDGRLRLDDADAAAGATDFLAAAGLSEAGVALVLAESPDGVAARVRVARDWTPPLLRSVLPPTVRVEAEADARVRVLD